MRESCLYGSVRGAVSNDRPYREHMQCSKEQLFERLVGDGEQCGLVLEADRLHGQQVGGLSASGSPNQMEWCGTRQ